MMRQRRHPLVAQDLIALVDHVVTVTGGDFAAASRRLDEVDNLLHDIAQNPGSGARLAPPLDGWLVRHGGRGHRLTVVFRAEPDKELLYIALVAFGGQDWMSSSADRTDFDR